MSGRVFTLAWIFMTLQLHGGTCSRVIAAEERSVLTVDGSSVEVLSLHNDNVVFALAADRDAGIGRLVRCDVVRGRVEEIHRWNDARSGIVVGTATNRCIAAAPVVAPDLRLGNQVTRFHLKAATAQYDGTSEIDLSDRVLFSLQAIHGDVVGTFGYPGTTKVVVESLITKKTLISISELSGNPAFSRFQLSDDAKTLFIGIGQRAANDLVVQSWSIATGREQWRVRHANVGTTSALCCLGTDRLVVGTELGHVYVLNEHDGTTSAHTSIATLQRHSPARVRQCDVSSDGSRIAVLAPERVVVFDLGRRQLSVLRTILRSDVSSIAVSTHGHLLACGVCEPTGPLVEVISLN